MMSFDLSQESYIDFRNIVSERTNGIVAWIGAGLSIPAGLPSWKELRKDLCESLNNKNMTLEPGDPERNYYLSQYESALREKNLWIAFQILKNALGKTTYKERIRNTLGVANSADVPDIYKTLWKMRLYGILNLNLDRLVMRAHSIIRPGKQVIEFHGCDAGHYLHVLQSAQPFVAELHGVSENENSWVFTKDDLNRLFAEAGYRTFITSCLTTRTVLFVGISADDLAVGGHLENLYKLGCDVGSHFWLTDRTDTQTDRWAESVGIRVIRYNNSDGTHKDLHECFEDLMNYVPKEEQVQPIPPSFDLKGDCHLLDPGTLAQKNAETIRKVLNNEASRILNSSAADKYDRYYEFCEKYDEPIYRAWYVGVPDSVFGYKILERVAKGAFGTVYRALDEQGNNIAIKILHHDIREQKEMLQSFRRGVKSMNILSARNVAGIVPYRKAAEIPAMVIMDFVEGMSLQQAVENRTIMDWTQILRIGVELAKIIRSSHQLPERVLHRDIRPANIMLRNGWNESNEWTVVVLDFDLSWHRDAPEVSVCQMEGSNGYVAPEQIRRNSKESTRNAAVDSYGFGMTLFFMRTGISPVFMQHQHTDWLEKLRTLEKLHRCNAWRSLPRRYFRMIESATKDRQVERWDMSQIEGELTRLQFAELNPGRVCSAELLAEELACRGLNSHYVWDPDELKAEMALPTGTSVTVIGNETNQEVLLHIKWQQAGHEQHSSVRKYLPNAFEKIFSILNKASWNVRPGGLAAYEMNISAFVSTSKLRNNMDSYSASLGKALEQLNFK